MPDLSLLDVAQAQIEFLRFQDAKLVGISRKLVDVLREKTSANRISVIIWNHLKSKFQLISSLGFQESFKETLGIDLGKSILGEVYKNKKSIYCPNILLDKRFGIQKRFRYNSLSFISCPILLRNQVVGFVSLSNFKENCHPIYQILTEKLCEDFALKFEKELSLKDSLEPQILNKNTVNKLNEIFNTLSINGAIYSTPSPPSPFGSESTNIFDCHIYGQCLQVYFLHSKDEFLQRWNNFDWLLACIKSLRETNPKNMSFLTRMNQLLLEVLGRKSTKFLISTFEIDLNKRQLNHISFDAGIAFIFNKSNSIKTLNPNSSKFISDNIKIKEDSVPLTEDSLIIILGPAITNLFEEPKKELKEIIENVVHTYHEEDTAKIIEEIKTKLEDSDSILPNESLLVIKV